MRLTLAVFLEAILGALYETLLEKRPALVEQAGVSLSASDQNLTLLLQQPFSGAVIDSRLAFAGSVFVALPGERDDGHNYILQAFERGAHLAIIQNPLELSAPVLDLRQAIADQSIDKLVETLAAVDPTAPLALLVSDSLSALQAVAKTWRSKLNLIVIGITGSVGKSTTKEVIADVLSQRFVTLKNPGNLNNEIGLPLTLLGLTSEHECAVLEMGFYVPGEIAFLCELARPQIGVITNIGTVHAERAGSQEAIARGKAELVQSLPPGPQGVAILNFDDPWVRRMASQTEARIFSYGLSPEATIWADEIESLGLDGISFRLHYHREELTLRVPLIGRHSVHTALRAAAVGIVLGLTWEEIVRGLHSGRNQLRLVSIKSFTGALILDDTYNASPESVLAALNLLDELERGQEGHKVAVLGDMLELGQYEQEGHQAVGARAAEVVDELITVGERARIVASAAWRAGLSKKAIASFTDNQQVIDYLAGHLSDQDIVLVKGSRGMQMEQIVSALETPQ